MTKKEFSSITRRLLPYVPGMRAKTDMLFVSPVTHTLRGIVLTGSIDPREFYAHAFIQPLFVPTEHLVLNLGWRVGGGSYSWNADASELIDELGGALRQEALPVLLRVQLPDDVITVAHELRRTGDGAVQQMMAYALAKAERVSEAIGALRDYRSTLDRTIAWQRRALERADQLTQALTFDSSQARQMLRQWEKETAERLTIAGFLSSET